jgi:hypothetical protein
LDGKGFETKQGQGIFSLFQIIQTSSKLQPASYSVGTGVISRPGHDVVPSSPSGAKVKNGFRHTSTPPIYLRAWMGDLYHLRHGVIFHKNTLLILTSQRTINIAYGFDVMGDKFLNQSLLA